MNMAVGRIINRLTHVLRAAHRCVVEELNLQYRGNISARFSSNSEADASELLETLKEMFSCIGTRKKVTNK